jgi:hypothetical protein
MRSGGSIDFGDRLSAQRICHGNGELHTVFVHDGFAVPAGYVETESVDMPAPAITKDSKIEHDRAVRSVRDPVKEVGLRRDSVVTNDVVRIEFKSHPTDLKEEFHPALAKFLLSTSVSECGVQLCSWSSGIGNAGLSVASASPSWALRSCAVTSDDIPRVIARAVKAVRVFIKDSCWLRIHF